MADYLSAFIAIATIAAIAAIPVMFAVTAPKPAPIASNYPRSRKHVRIVHGAIGYKIAYYNHAGRKVTVRNFKDYSNYGTVCRSAKALGYRIA